MTFNSLETVESVDTNPSKDTDVSDLVNKWADFSENLDLPKEIKIVEDKIKELWVKNFEYSISEEDYNITAKNEAWKVFILPITTRPEKTGLSFTLIQTIDENWQILTNEEIAKNTENVLKDFALTEESLSEFQNDFDKIKIEDFFLDKNNLFSKFIIHQDTLDINNNENFKTKIKEYCSNNLVDLPENFTINIVNSESTFLSKKGNPWENWYIPLKSEIQIIDTNWNNLAEIRALKWLIYGNPDDKIFEWINIFTPNEIESTRNNFSILINKYYGLKVNTMTNLWLNTYNKWEKTLIIPELDNKSVNVLNIDDIWFTFFLITDEISKLYLDAKKREKNENPKIQESIQKINEYINQRTRYLNKVVKYSEENNSQDKNNIEKIKKTLKIIEENK